MKDNTNLKNQFFESNRELTDLFVELYKDYESLQNNHGYTEKKLKQMIGKLSTTSENIGKDMDAM